MSKTAVRIISILIAAAVLIGGLYLFRTYQQRDSSGVPDSSQPEEEDAQPQPVSAMQEQVIPAEAMIVKPESLRDLITVNGSTLANQEVMISSEVAGTVRKILFKEGSHVTQGSPMVILDTEELEAQRQRLEVRKRLTASVAERLKALYEAEGVSLQEYETAQAEADQVVAEIKLLDVQIEKRTVRAPFSGRIGLKLVSEGSYISSGSPIVGLVSLDPIHLQFAVPERYTQVLQQGSEVLFQLSGSTDMQSARVIAREPAIDPETRTLEFKASARNPRERILPGAFAKVTVNLSTYEGTLMVPTEAIIPELGGKKVFRYKNGKAESVVVETGIRQNEFIQVVSGLEPGDTILTTAVLQLRDGLPVRITNLSNPIGQR